MPPICQATLHFDTHKATFWFASTLPGDNIRAVWNYQFEASFQSGGHCSTLDLKHVPLEHPPSFSKDVCVLTMFDQELTLLPCRPTPILEQPILASLGSHLFDQFGSIATNQKPDCNTILFTQPLPAPTCTLDLVHVLGTMQQLNFRWTLDFSSNIFTCHTKANDTTKQIWARFWSSLMDESHCTILGRKPVLDVDSNQVTFVPLRQGVAPESAFRLCLAVLAARAALQNLPIQADETLTQVTIKFASRPLWQGPIPSKCPMSVIFAIVKLSLGVVWGNLAIRLIYKGKQIMPESNLSDYDPEDLRFHVTHELRGGAGSKDQQRQIHQSAIAAILLEQGHHLEWVKTAVDKLMEKTPLQKLHKLTSTPMSGSKIAAINKACQEVGVQIPSSSKPQTQKAFPDAPWQKAKKLRTDVINPAEFALVPDFFLNSDGTATNQVHQVRAQATGLCLMTPGEAAPWIREGTTLSSDELAIVVLGKVPETPLQQTKVTFPCKNADGALVLLQGTLLQLGNKHVKWRADDKPVQPDHCQLIAVTLYKQDFSEAQWQDALQSTPSFIRKLLQVDQLHTAISAIWGRSLRAGRTPASPIQATTIQMHCTVEKTHLKALLRTSGFNSLFCTPKDQSGKLATEFQVIWMGSDHVKVTAASAKVAGCLGLVRGRNNALGLRFDQATYTEAWKQLCPDTEMPVRSDTDQNYKIQGLPFGCSQKMLTEWGQQQAWPCKPTRALGPQAWIVRCDSAPKPDHIYMFNGNPVLITHLMPKENDSRQVLLGPRSKTGTQDPWTKKVKTHGPHTQQRQQVQLRREPLMDHWKPSSKRMTNKSPDCRQTLQRWSNHRKPTPSRLNSSLNRQHSENSAMPRRFTTPSNTCSNPGTSPFPRPCNTTHEPWINSSPI